MARGTQQRTQKSSEQVKCNNLSKTKGTHENKVSFIICEGPSEGYYFSALKNKFNLTDYQVSPQYHSTTSVSQLKKIIEKHKDGYSRIFWIVDMDRIILQQNKEEGKIYQQLILQYKDDGEVSLCESLPSFELWLLLHFVFTEKTFSRQEEVVNELKHFIPTYEKAKANRNLEDTTFPKIPIAYSNAQKLPKNNEGKPFTKIWKLFNEIESLRILHENLKKLL